MEERFLVMLKAEPGGGWSDRSTHTTYKQRERDLNFMYEYVTFTLYLLLLCRRQNVGKAVSAFLQ